MADGGGGGASGAKMAPNAQGVKGVGSSRTWRVTKRYGSSYTGGAVALCPPPVVAEDEPMAPDASKSGDALPRSLWGAGAGMMACMCAERVSLLDLATGTGLGFVQDALPVRGGLRGSACRQQVTRSECADVVVLELRGVVLYRRSSVRRSRRLWCIRRSGRL